MSTMFSCRQHMAASIRNAAGLVNVGNATRTEHFGFAVKVKLKLNFKLNPCSQRHAGSLGSRAQSDLSHLSMQSSYFNHFKFRPHSGFWLQSRSTISIYKNLANIRINTRSHSSQFNSRRNPQSPDPNRPKRVQMLTIATYVSCMIGALIMSAVFYRFYGQFRRKARGIQDIDVPLFGRRNKLFSRYRGYVLHRDTLNPVLHEIPWFEVRPDDVWVVSFPKAGTTWLQEIVYLICNDFDYDKAKATTIEERFPFLEFIHPGLKAISQSPSPRFIKTHLPFSLLPKQLEEKKPKVLYIARNPKDTTVSLLAFTKLLAPLSFQGEIEDFANLFLEGTVFFGPWEKHVREGWEHRDQDNVLFLTYEDLHKDFRGTVKCVAEFLGRSMSERQLDDLEQHCSFRSMQANAAVNYSWHQGALFRNEGQFMRKGQVGDWKNHLSEDVAAKYPPLTAALEPLGLHFEDS